MSNNVNSKYCKVIKGGLMSNLINRIIEENKKDIERMEKLSKETKVFLETYKNLKNKKESK